MNWSKSVPNVKINENSLIGLLKVCYSVQKIIVAQAFMSIWKITSVQKKCLCKYVKTYKSAKSVQIFLSQFRRVRFILVTDLEIQFRKPI